MQLSPFMVAGRALWHQRQHVPSLLPSLESSNSTYSSERNRQFSHVEGEELEEEESGAKET
jgi:hypothetical protein